MSNIISLKDWLENSITNGYLNYYEYSEFKNIQPLGNGSYGSVVRANWKNTDTVLAVKSFNNQALTFYKEVINELKLHREVHFHANILKFYGITKTETDINNQMKNYALVLEYADSGTLGTYLSENKLEWRDKLCLALQLSNAVLCLHERGIIHRDLHANNILVHQKNIKLADFGLSKKIAASSSNTSKILGVLPYVDPKKFCDKNYKINKKSDVYSVGIIMWQISSGRKPFENEEACDLILSVRGGKSEEIIDGTPIEYSELYKKCWKFEPDERPNIDELVSTLKSIILEKNDILIEEKMNHLPEKNEETADFSSFSSGNIPATYWYQINAENGDMVAQYNLGRCYEDGTGIEKDLEKAFEWYEKSAEQGDNNAQNSLGSFYESDFGIEKDLEKATYWYHISAENGNKFAQYNLGRCYECGNGVEKDLEKAFGWYEKSAEQGDGNAQNSLGSFYENNFGTEKDLEKATYWYRKAAENGNKFAQNNLGRCYEYGDGIEKDLEKAFEWYKKSAEQGDSNAQNSLGRCYERGYGTEKDLERAFEWYKKSAEQGDGNAQNSLGSFYESDFGIEKDLEKATYWYRKAAENGNKFAREKVEFSWIKNAIKQKFIKYIKWNELTVISNVGAGYFVSVYKAIWIKINDYVIFKKLYNGQKEGVFQHTVQMQFSLSCENIIRFIGITQDPSSYGYGYCIVEEYADCGDLRYYLAENFKSLNWDDKYQLAFGITNGLYYLHNEDIIHRNLNAKSIVINKGRAKIASFGYAKSVEAQTDIHNELFGIAPYVAPELSSRFSLHSLHLLHSKKTDVYSLGVLLWEVSSGCPPFESYDNNELLIMNICQGLRETMIENTPTDYYKLYTDCWNEDPEKRPIIEDVYDKLKCMLPKNNEIIKDNDDAEDDDDSEDFEGYDSNIEIDWSEI